MIPCYNHHMGYPFRFDHELIRKTYEECHNGREVARRLGISYQTIQRYLHRLGIHPGKGHGGKRQRIHKLDLDLVKRLYWGAGFSTLQIGKRFGVSDEVVRRQMDRANIPRRGMIESRARGSHSPQWKGGKSKMNAYRRESYEIVAICLGHPLPKGMVIHHFDEDYTNNDPSNIVIFQCQSDHQRYHQQLLRSPHPDDREEAILLVSENGGRWLPPPAAPIPSEPDRDHLDLLERPTRPLPAPTE